MTLLLIGMCHCVLSCLQRPTVSYFRSWVASPRLIRDAFVARAYFMQPCPGGDSHHSPVEGQNHMARSFLRLSTNSNPPMIMAPIPT